MTHRRTRWLGAALLLLWTAPLSALERKPMHPYPHSQRPALREEILLNGAWETGGPVPQYDGIAGLDQRVFARRVDVPAAWAGKRIRVEFGAVNFIADVLIDGRPAGRHVGGWNPFAVDVTGRVRAGESFELKVEVKGPKHPPITDEKGGFAWPVGGWANRGGIADDVWLRAYGPVFIEDAFIQPSYRKRTLTVDYTLVNPTGRARSARIEAEAARAGSAAVERRFAGPRVELAPGETKVVQAVFPWPDPELWWPDRPALYHLTSRLTADGEAIDAETRRFGFREVWIEGTQFRLNGARVNLFGDYQVYGDGWYTRPEIYTPEAWPKTCDQILSCNIRILRWHHNPVPQYILDVCDEKGLLVCDESANYARDFHKRTNQALYLENCRKWIAPWVRADRNHPCVYLWNATNEMTYDFCGKFDAKALRELGDAIKALDPTRPVGYDGDKTVDGDLVDYHYPEGYNREPKGSIYSWTRFLKPDRPTGTGECLHTRSPLPEVQTAVARNTWWLGIWMRGLRYTNWTNVKPACWWFQWKDGFRGARAENMRNAYAPVALFDKEYDDLGIAPYVTGTTPGGTLPEVAAGAKLERTLVLYNDEFRGTAVDVEVEVRVGGKAHASGRRRYEVPLGEHVDLPCSFHAPNAAGREMELVLRTAKEGRPKFEEVRRFRITGAGAGTVDAPGTLTLGEAQAPARNAR